MGDIANYVNAVTGLSNAYTANSGGWGQDTSHVYTYKIAYEEPVVHIRPPGSMPPANALAWLDERVEEMRVKL